MTFHQVLTGMEHMPPLKIKPAMPVSLSPALWVKQLAIRLSCQIPQLSRWLSRKRAREAKARYASLTLMLTCIALSSFSAISVADPSGLFSIIEPKPISELWLNPGFYSYHFKKDMGFNNNNFGLGGEYRYSTTHSIVAGSFHNSDWQTSHYVGWSWQPLALGPVRMGMVVGGIDGYPKAFNGGWFPAALPEASLEYKNIGANLIFTPGYKDKLYAALSLQLKVKIY